MKFFKLFGRSQKQAKSKVEIVYDLEDYSAEGARGDLGTNILQSIAGSTATSIPIPRLLLDCNSDACHTDTLVDNVATMTGQDCIPHSWCHGSQG